MRPDGPLPGQRRGGVPLRHPQERDAPPGGLRHQARGEGRRHRLRRAPPQQVEAPLDHRVPGARREDGGVPSKGGEGVLRGGGAPGIRGLTFVGFDKFNTPALAGMAVVRNPLDSRCARCSKISANSAQFLLNTNIVALGVGTRDKTGARPRGRAKHADLTWASRRSSLDRDYGDTPASARHSFMNQLTNWENAEARNAFAQLAGWFRFE